MSASIGANDQSAINSSFERWRNVGTLSRRLWRCRCQSRKNLIKSQSAGGKSIHAPQPSGGDLTLIVRYYVVQGRIKDLSAEQRFHLVTACYLHILQNLSDDHAHPAGA